LQLFGTCEQVNESQLVDAIQLFTQRFPDFGKAITSPEDFHAGKTERKLFSISVQRLKLVDEPHLGRRNYISLTLH
jgi:hypothetical protein